MYGMVVPTGGDDSYLSGIWRPDLARGLLWTPQNCNRTSTRNRYVAPTWSWASINGKVLFPSRGSGSQDNPAFLVTGLERGVDDHLGPLIATKLTLLAKLRRLDGVVKKVEESWYPLEARTGPWYPLDLRVEENSIGHGALDINSRSEKSNVWMMECMVQQSKDFRELPSALLVYNPGSTPDTFERLGVGRLNEDSLEFFKECEPQTIVLI